MAADKTSWHERARSLDIRTKAFINGNYTDCASGQTFDSINPGTGKLLARVSSGDTEDINRAVSAARAAFRTRHLPLSDFTPGAVVIGAAIRLR